MAELYGAHASQAGQARCPGEQDCQIFESAAEPKDHACQGCPLLPTKPYAASAAIADADGAALLDEVEQIAGEQRAGFAYTAAELPPLVYELLLRWHANIATYERNDGR